jgi:CheY-like chemotaxis protein/HPt (histidine-containing phosphotransfer) domain-containing protein
LKLEIAPGVPKELIGDGMRLTQILTNLLGNALKFTPEGYIKVQVDYEDLSPGLISLLIDVEDSGIGIEAEQLNNIFLKFEQASQLTSNKYGGTGLGLTIAKQLVELQGGCISVSSKLGEGTTFSFSIPYSLGNKANLREIALTHNPQPDLSLSHLSILMAEDNLVNQAVATKFLKNWDVSCVVAENGKIAVEKAQHQEFDIILMDLQMPEMDGFEASRLIRQAPQYDYTITPIIAITAGASGEIADKIKEHGLTDYLLKPFTPDQLLAILKKYNTKPVTQEATTIPSDNMPDLKKNTPEPGGPLDISGIITVAGGDSEFMQELLKLYVRQFTDLPNEINKAKAKEDRLELRRIFHKLRPSVVMLKATDLQALGDKIHNDLHDQSIPFVSIADLLVKYTHKMQYIQEQLAEIQQQENLV